jgi:RNA 2',3'-cyclic 3'-phosphodiesterase
LLSFSDSIALFLRDLVAALLAFLNLVDQMTPEDSARATSHANWFFGLPVDAEFIAAIPPPPPGFRLFSKRDVHITVAFLGPCGAEAARRALDALDHILANASFSPVDYALGELIPLGHARRYSALSATLTAGSAEAAAIIAALRAPLVAAAGAKPDTRPPLPHATLARPSRRAGARDRAAGLAWARSLDLGQFHGTLDRVALYTWAEDRQTGLFEIVAERPLRGPRPIR